MKLKNSNQIDLFESKLLNGITILDELIREEVKETPGKHEDLYPIGSKLTVLSFGGGQDSTALLYLYAFDESFRVRYAPEDFIVIMSNTGDEHPETYVHVKEIQLFCAKQKIPFFLIDSEMGFHPRMWPSLRHFYRLTNTCGSKAFRKNCTDNLKIQPIYKFLEQYLHKTYQLEQYGRKKAYYEFAEKYGKISVLIGISKGEERRVSGNEDNPVWQRKSIHKVFPLMELGLDRNDCQEYIRSVNKKVPPPSNCMLCPYMSEIELIWLFNNYPFDFWDWVNIEANKIEKFKDRPVNLGVWKDKLLEEKLKEAQAKYAHLSIEEINAYKMSHGHCVKSKY